MIAPATHGLSHPLGTVSAMGALKPWHLLILSFCCLGVTGVVAAVAVVFARGKRRRPPGA
ncbi:hypothetical protein GCM10025331_22250 [Actinoplanes utahensis]|nr:hypothetical protein Aut01nite_35140 [Actinoplanes utahensis]